MSKAARVAPSRSPLVAYIDRRLNEEASTRAIAVFRIAITSLAYMRFGPEMSLHLAESSFQAVVSVAFFGLYGLAFIGFRTRLALVGAAAVMALMYFQIGRELTPGWSHHHHYMLWIATILLAFAPSERSFSVDRVLAIRAAERAGTAPPPECGPTWAQTLLVYQLAAMYFWTAIDKTNWSFLSGDRLERILEWVYAGTWAYPIVTGRWFTAGGSTLVVLIEYLLPAMLLLRWRLPWAFAVAFVLHAGFYVMLPVQTYSATMIAFYVLVTRPDAVHAFIDRYLTPKLAHA